MLITRRAVLAGLAGAALGPGRAAAATPEAVAAILERSGLAELSGFALADAATGELLEGHRAQAALPPASVVKLLTARYALATLGPEFRFRTRVLAAGPLADGVLKGDLALVGGGDPLLDTDALGDLAAAVAARGVRSVAGRFLVVAGALPQLPEIEPGQPEDAGYNPAISGMNLNFNRVHLDWAPGEAGPRTRFRATGERFDVPAEGFALEFAPAGGPRRRIEAGRETWTLPRASLPGRGSMWLPVAEPAPYAGRTFRALAAQAGLALPAAELAATAPAGTVLAEHAGEPLAAMMRGMLRYSTNLTAEVAGLSASGAPDLARSAAAMAGWARGRYGIAAGGLVNHSGLSERARMRPADLLLLLVAERDALPAMLRERPILDAARQPLDTPERLLAKTGTLDFASALAGYLERPGGRRLAFAILAADPAARAAIPPELRADPPGATAWATRARSQEQALVRRWTALYAG